MDHQYAVEMLREKNWALMDIEYIRTSQTHRCVRKLYILVDNGYDELELDFYPCVRYKDLETKYKRSFKFCQREIHKLTYNPKQYSPVCAAVLGNLNEFIVNNDIGFILYKGGTIEKDLCEELDIPSYNIECFPEVEKVHSHDPRTEVYCYFNQVVELY